MEMESAKLAVGSVTASMERDTGPWKHWASGAAPKM